MADDPAVDEVIKRLLAPAQGAVVPGGDFQASFDQAMREIARSRSGINNLQQLQTNRINTDYTTGSSLLGEQKTDAINALLDRLAGQGILRSGINIQEQGNISRDFQHSLNELLQQKTRGMEDLQNNVTAGLQDLTNREEELKIQKASYDAQKALEAAQAQAAMNGYGPTGNYIGGGYGGGVGGFTAPAQRAIAPPAPRPSPGPNPNIYKYNGPTQATARIQTFNGPKTIAVPQPDKVRRGAAW